MRNHQNIFFMLVIYFATTCIPLFAQWINRAPMPTPRQEVPHVVLDGEIYVPGGLVQTGQATSVVEVFAPETNTWSTIPPLPQSLHHVAATAVNGRLYVIGGYAGATFNETSAAYVYDFNTQTWPAVKNMPQPRGAAIAVTYDNKIYVIGGTVNGVASGVNEVYDPATNNWETRTAMPTAREHLAAAVIDSLIYVIGGRDFGFGRPGNYRRLEAYSPAKDSWKTLPEMPTRRGGLAATVHDGLLYVLGGEIPGVFSDNEIYDPQINEWGAGPALPTARHGMGAVTIGDTIFVIGGGLIAGLRATDVNEGLVISRPSSVGGQENIPVTASLSSNYPNPFNPTTNFRISLGTGGHVALKIYNMKGQLVSIAADTDFAAGEHALYWSADHQPSGIYLATLVWNGIRTDSKKIILLR